MKRIKIDIAISYTPVYVALLLLLWGCQEDTVSVNLPPEGFQTTVEVDGRFATISWTEAVDPEGEAVVYSLFLNDQLVVDNYQQTEYVLDNLDFTVEYTGNIVASDPAANTVTASFIIQIGPADIDWTLNFGDTGSDLIYAMDLTMDGGYILAGYSSEGVDKGNGSDDVRVLKVDGSGAVQWNFRYGGISSDRAFAIKELPDGEMIVAGSSYSDELDVPDNHGQRDIWVFKLDHMGNLTRSKNLGGAGDDIGYAVQPTMDGGSIVVGTTSSSESGDVKSVNNGNSDVWIVKLQDDLTLEWERSFGTENYDEARSVQQSAGGDFIIAGSSMEILNGENLVSSQGFLLVLDVAGNLQSQYQFGGSGLDQISDMQPTSDGGFVLVGRSTSTDGNLISNNGSFDYWVTRLDDAAEVIWSGNFGGSGMDEAYSVYSNQSSGFLVAGRSFSSDGDVSGNHGESDFWVVKINQDGQLVWEKNMGGTRDEEAHAVIQTTDGGVVVAGYSRSSDLDVRTNVNNNDLWVVKLK